MEAAAVNIAKAKELKAQGNEAFKAGNYNAAMVHYHQIFMYVHGFSEGSGSSQSMPGQTTQPVSAETMKEIKDLKVVHFSNLAACHLKLGQSARAAAVLQQALLLRAACYASPRLATKVAARLIEAHDGKLVVSFGGVPVFEIALLAAAAYGYATGAFEGQ